MTKLSRKELADIAAMAGAFQAAGGAHTPGTQLDLKALERGTRIKEWGRLARDGVGLGYGRGTLDDGRRTDYTNMSAETFEQITRLVESLPIRVQCVLIHLYQVSDKAVVSYTAMRLGTTRGQVEELRDQGLNVLYGALCVRITEAA